MYAHARWHAEGLRWLGSILMRIADRLERASIAAACDPRSPRDDPIDALRARYY
jgi:hypothetical protein